MGLFRVRAGLGEISAEFDFVVDTGAFYSVAPAELLRRLSTRIIDKKIVRISDGSRKEWERGVISMSLGGVTLPTQILFGDAEDCFLLGSLTLDEFGLCVDTQKKRLVAVECVDVCKTVVQGFAS